MFIKHLRSIPWGSLFALIVSITGCVAFAVLFDGALQGFSTQLNTLATVGKFSTLRWVLLVVSVSLLVIVVGLLFVGAAATSVSAHFNAKSDIPDEHSRTTQAITSPCVLGILTFALSCLVLFWSLIVSISAVFASLYLIFISTIYSFCSLVDNQCVDFSVLLPAIVSRISNKKVDLKFCKDKKELLCSAENNQVWPFTGALFFSFISLAGLIYFLMCMTANYTRIRSERRARKGEHYAMNQGTVDSNSFILTNMGK